MTARPPVRVFAALLLSLLLCACHSLPPTAPPAQLSWPEHRARILSFDSWQLQGRLNIRSENESNTINLRWIQQADAFEINLSGTLGLGAVRISGSGQGVVIEKAGEDPLFAPDLEAVSAEYLGYAFPVGKLYYWIRGVTSPGAESEFSLNENQRLDRLHEDQWQLQYDRYMETPKGYILPGRIRMQHPPYRLTFLINQWEVMP